jgi:CheY-like chemotaxis protein
VRNLVGMHGGQVYARSEGLGRGSTFTVRLPVSDEALPAAVPAPQQAAGREALSILLIEDNADACETLRQLLALEGHQVETASDGKSGLAAAVGGAFDVLICDIGLPGMDGLELIGRMRGADGGAKPYAIAVSGYCQAEDRTRALEAGFDHYCVKPVTPDVLLAAIGERVRS